MPVRTIEALFEQAPLPLAMFEGREHRFKFANSAYQTLFFQGKKLIGRTVKDVAPEVHEQGFIALLDNVFESGETHRGVETPVTLEQNDGTSKSFFLNFVYQAMKNDRGEVAGVLAVAVDVTEQVRAREVVESQQNWLESILNTLPVPLFLMEPDQGKIKFYNDAVRALFGDTLKGTTTGDRIRSGIKVLDRNGVEVPPDQVPSARASRGEEIKQEYSLDIGGARIEVSALSKTLPAKYGHDRTALLVLQDVTAIREAEEHYRLLTELAPQMPFVADAEGAIIYFSPRWYEYTGAPSISPTSMEWKNQSFHHPDDLKRTIDRWNESVTTGKSYEIEYRLRRADGEYRWHLGRAEAVKSSDGKILKWVGTNVDIHDQKRLQSELEAAKVQAETASSAKSAFLANMSHEIRTPLGAILGFSELVKATPLSVEAREYLEVIERNGRNLTRLIDDILDLSKVESGKLDLENVSFSINQLIFEVLELLSERARAKGIYLRFEAESGSLQEVHADPTRLRQILINLIGNAVKFTDHGGVSIVLRSRSLDGGRVSNLIEIRDTGPGIKQEEARRLFHPFVQADHSTNRKYGGTGLGLALSRRLAEAMGGEVRIERTNLGEGSVFVIELNLELAKPNSIQVAKVSVSKENSLLLDGARILVVDDSDDNRVLMNRFLCKEGALVAEAASGEEALARTNSTEFDVVLMDIQMPGMDGYQSLKALRNMGFSKPVIALTAHAMLEEKKRALGAGFSDHVTKPVSQRILVTAIANLL